MASLRAGLVLCSGASDNCVERVARLSRGRFRFVAGSFQGTVRCEKAKDDGYQLEPLFADSASAQASLENDAADVRSFGADSTSLAQRVSSNDVPLTAETGREGGTGVQQVRGQAG